MEEEKPQENIKVQSETLNTEPLNLQSRPNPFAKYYKFIILALIVCLGVGLFVFFTSFNKKSTVGKAPPPDPENVLLATVGNKKIYRNDVKSIALEQYLNSSINDEVLKQFLNIAIERKILDNQASMRKIEIPSQKTKTEYYNLLKNKVTEGEILSIEETDVSWWIPPAPDYEQKKEFQEQRSQQQQLANEVEAGLKTNDDAFLVVKKVLEKYKSFQPILGFNGAIIAKITDVPVNNVRTIKFNSLDADKPFFKLLYSMNTGEIRKGIWPDGSGGAVIKAVNVTRGERVDYETWLAQQTKELVQYNQEGISKL
jgi:hypothetical protein